MPANNKGPRRNDAFVRAYRTDHSSVYVLFTHRSDLTFAFDMRHFHVPDIIDALFPQVAYQLLFRKKLAPHISSQKFAVANDLQGRGCRPSFEKGKMIAEHIDKIVPRHECLNDDKRPGN